MKEAYMKKFLSLLLVLSLSLTLFACGGNKDNTVAVTGVKITASATTVVAGATITLSAEVTPSNATTKTVSWTSSDTAVATVKDGVVTGVAAGTVTIAATAKSDKTKTDSVSITVTAAQLENPTAVTIVADNDATTVVVGSELSLSATVTPAGASQEVTWSSDDETIATIADGIVTGVAAGSVNITATSVADTTITGTYAITVTPAYVEPEAIEIESKTSVTAGSTITLTYTAIAPDGASNSDLATWTIDNEDNATITTNAAGKGRLTGLLANTQVTVYVSVTTQSGKVLTADTVISIIEAGVVTLDPPESVIISGSPRIAEGITNSFRATVYPSTALQGVVWSSSDETVATVSSQGKVKGISEGTCYITAASAADKTITASYQLTIVPLPSIEPVTDMNGFAVNVFEAVGALTDHDPRLDKYGSSDKAAKITAWEATESKFNCVLGVKPYPNSAPWGNARIKWMNSNASTGVIPTNDSVGSYEAYPTYGGDQASIFVMPSYWIKQLVEGNSIVDITEYYNSYGFSQMTNSLTTQTTYQSKIYGLPTELAVASINVTDGIVYNYGLLKSLGLESPAKLFNEGKWSFSDFVEYCKTASAALSAKGSDYTVLSGRPALYYLGMCNASGLALCDVNTLTTNFSTDIARSALSTLRKIKDATGWGTISWDAQVTTFNTQNSLMQSAYWWFIKNSARFTDTLWGDGTTEYGYVPYPWADTLTKDDTMCGATPGSVYTLAARTYPDGITAEDIYKVWYYANQQTDVAITDDITYSADEAIYTLAESKISDPESISAVQWFTSGKIVFDPTYTLGTSYHTSYLAPDTEKVVVDGTDYDEALSHISLYQTALEESYGAAG